MFFSAVRNATYFSIVLGLWSLSVEIVKAFMRLVDCLSIVSTSILLIEQLINNLMKGLKFL